MLKREVAREGQGRILCYLNATHKRHQERPSDTWQHEYKEVSMRKNVSMNKTRKIRSNNQRRVLLKKLHHRVLLRRKQFAMEDMNQEFQQAC